MNKASLRSTPVLITIILLVSAALFAVIIKTAPKPERVMAKKVPRLVETAPLKRMSVRPQWLGGGEVSAAQRVQLSAQVSGKIEAIDAAAVPGAELAKGSVLARIEQSDYLLQVEQKKAALIQAQAALDLEQGQAQLAKEEYELALNQVSRNGDQNAAGAFELAEESSALVLRKPQIASALAGVKTAQANLDLAKLNLARTQIKMPFAGQIITRSANTGSQVTSSNTLFDVVATDEFWLQVKVPQKFLALLDRDKAVVIRQGDQTREAKILHALAEVDAKDRQAKVLISIPQPHASKNSSQATLLLGSYVNCLLFAKAIDDVYVIENKHIKDDGSVWVVNDKKLYKRNLAVIYQDRQKSWIREGFVEGDQLLISTIGVVTEGTPVRLSSLAAKKTPTDATTVKGKNHEA